MNEGIGSTYVLVVIVVFIAFASGYMAYNVNHTKAFRMKNKIVAVLEKYNGDCNFDCEKEIKDYAKEIGYNSPNPTKMNFCSKVKPKQYDDFTTEVEAIPFPDPGFCYYKIKEPTREGEDLVNKAGYYYHVITCINIELPIVHSVLPEYLLVEGDTKTLYS